MAKRNVSAGILLFRLNNKKQLEVLLVHPGGPYNKYKDAGAWSIPKGEYDTNETALNAAKREFEEELGTILKADYFITLKPVKQKGGKTIIAFACEGNLDCTTVKSNTLTFEYPYRSGKFIEIPEVDKAEWFEAGLAKEKINQAQAALITELKEILSIE